MSTTDDIEAGMPNAAEDPTVLVGRSDPDSEGTNRDFRGDFVFQAGTPRGSEERQPWHAIDGVRGLAAKSGNGVVGFGGDFSGNGIVGLGGAGLEAVPGGNGVVGVGGVPDPRREPNVLRPPGAGTIGISKGDAAGAVGVCTAEWKSSSGRSVQTGVLGFSAETQNLGFGVYGRCDSPAGAGVSGRNDEGDAVSGFSAGGTGVRGSASKGVGVFGETGSGPGVVGSSSSGHGVFGSGGIGVQGRGTFSGVVGVVLSPGGHAGVLGWGLDNVPAGRFVGDVLVEGSLVVVNPANKHAAIAHADGSHRLLYSLESPECRLEDFGEATLVKGKAAVKLGRDFAAVINTASYHVFVTPYGDSNGLYVSRRERGGFTVMEQGGGKARLRFSYRIVAEPKGPKAKRLPKIKLPPKPTQLKQPTLPDPLLKGPEVRIPEYRRASEDRYRGEPRKGD